MKFISGVVALWIGAGLAGMALAADDARELSPARTNSARVKKFPPRDPKAGTNLVDLTDHYNFVLSNNWSDVRGNDLASLPTGLQTFLNTEFDVRGLIQVALRSRKHPPSVANIPIQQSCRRIHFLHSAIGADNAPHRTWIGSYTVHYANGEQREIPLTVGVELGDWWEQPKTDENKLSVAWIGDNAKSRPKGKTIRLFKFTWHNPLPSVPVTTLDFRAIVAGPSPFLVAMTTE